MEENNIANAYTEVLDILKYIPKKDYDKIPREVLNKMMQNYNEKYQYSYNQAKSYEEQEVSEVARGILEWLNQNYLHEPSISALLQQTILS